MHEDAHSISTHDGEIWAALPFLTLELDHVGGLVRPICRADRQNCTEPQNNAVKIKELGLYATSLPETLPVPVSTLDQVHAIFEYQAGWGRHHLPVSTFCAVVVVGFSSHARILGKCSTIHFPPALFFLKWRLACAH